MKIISLVKSEFKKNFSIKKLVASSILFFLFSILILKITSPQFIPPVSFDSFVRRDEIEELSKKEKLTFEEEFYLNRYIKIYEIIEELKRNNIEPSSWNTLTLFNTLSNYFDINFLIEKILDDSTNHTVKEVCESSVTPKPYSESRLHDLCTGYTKEELKKEYDKNSERISGFKKILIQNNYYEYLAYWQELGEPVQNELENIIIDKKIKEDTNFIVMNSKVYANLNSKHISSMDCSDELKKKVEKDVEQYKQILAYSSVHEIKHDYSFNGYYGNGVESNSDMNANQNAKTVVNQIYHFSFLILLIISINYGGIVSREHANGTIKNIISAPIRRWKILASKFIYLILNMYILWFLALVILTIVVGMKYGFTDLLTPKLIYSGGKVIEINYYLYTLKNIFIASIPMICFLSILFFFSAVTLNTSVTVGVTTGISIISIVFWLLSAYGNFKEIIYTPIWYFDLGFIFNNSFYYIESLMKIYFPWQNGVLISFLVAIILYIMANIIYIKRDIKN